MLIILHRCPKTLLTNFMQTPDLTESCVHVFGRCVVEQHIWFPLQRVYVLLYRSSMKFEGIQRLVFFPSQLCTQPLGTNVKLQVSQICQRISIPILIKQYVKHSESSRILELNLVTAWSFCACVCEGEVYCMSGNCCPCGHRKCFPELLTLDILIVKCISLLIMQAY